MPFYHNQYMEQRRQQEHSGSSGNERINSPKDIPHIDHFSLDEQPRVQSPEEQAETLRRLKPVSLSSLQLQNMTTQPLTHINHEAPPKSDPKKHRTRWQFGIRSRNLPHEAMHCVYKALVAQKAEWEVPGIPDNGNKRHTSFPVHVSGATRLSETMSPSRAPSPEMTRTSHQRQSHEEYRDFSRRGRDGRRADSSGALYETDDEDVDIDLTPQEYIPKDPWCVQVRWRKDGMLPVTLPRSLSTTSSRQDLSDYGDSQRNSLIGSSISMQGAIGNISTVSSTSALAKSQYEWSSGSCYVYMDVQLYTIESQSDRSKGTYLVDFKCAGYEPLIEKSISENHKELVGMGYRVSEKDATSPQPFLDMTNRLVIYLASEKG